MTIAEGYPSASYDLSIFIRTGVRPDDEWRRFSQAAKRTSSAPLQNVQVGARGNLSDRS